MSTKWTFGRRQAVCADTGRAFEDGERHISMVEIAGGELRRSDLSLDAWKRRGHGEAPPAVRTEGDDAEEGPLSWWMTRHRVHTQRTVQLDLESLEQLFERLEGRGEVQVRELRYLLCLLLMRKRRLSIEKVERGPEGERMIVRRPRREERYEVFVYDFTTERMEELRAELQSIFDGAESDDGVSLDGDDSDEDAGERASKDATAAPESELGHEVDDPQPDAAEPVGTEDASL